MDFGAEHSLGNSSNPTIKTELPQAVPDDPYNPSMSSYTCIDVEEAQYYFPNKVQVVMTLEWLTSNYEPAENVSLPRCGIYKHYTEFCKRQQFQPVNAASFGKVIRQVFPELKTRRLGTRGQSKYHYYGIRVKKSSPYYKELAASQRQFTQPMLGSPGGWPPLLFNMSPSKSNTMQASTSQPVEDKAGDFLLPEFPDAEQIQLSDSTLIGKVDSFLEIYRVHCRKLLDIVLNSKLDEVHFYIERFWRELSGASQQLLSNGNVALAVAVCDKLLYQTISDTLMPGIVHHLIPSLLHAIRHFSCGFMKHLEGALSHQPPVLIERKLEVARDFANLLKRKTSLSHLAQAMCTVLKTDGSVKQMLHDWKKRTEHATVRSQLLWLVNDEGDGPNRQTINKYLCEFVCLLDKHITVEDHLKWLESVRKRCLSQHDDKDEEERNDHARRFMLQFCYLSNLIIRDQTLRSATSFGSFHLLHLMYEEYLLYVLDVKNIQKHEKAMWKQLHGPEAKVPDSFLTSLGVASLNRAYAPAYKYKAIQYQSTTTGGTLGSLGTYSQSYHGGEMMPRTVSVPQAYPTLHTHNSAQPSIPNLTTSQMHYSHDSSTTAMQPTFQDSSPGGFASSSFAPIQYSPQMASQSLGLSPVIASSPLIASSSPMTAPPKLAPLPSFQATQTVTTCVKSSSAPPYGTLNSAPQTSHPLNLSNDGHEKPFSEINASPVGTTKFIATQRLKASLVDGNDGKESVNGSSKTKITLSVPLAHGLHLSKGQILKLSDGKSYNIDDVQTVLKEMNATTSQESSFPAGEHGTPTKAVNDTSTPSASK